MLHLPNTVYADYFEKLNTKKRREYFPFFFYIKGHALNIRIYVFFIINWLNCQKSSHFYTLQYTENVFKTKIIFYFKLVTEQHS